MIRDRTTIMPLSGVGLGLAAALAISMASSAAEPAFERPRSRPAPKPEPPRISAAEMNRIRAEAETQRMERSTRLRQIREAKRATAWFKSLMWYHPLGSDEDNDWAQQRLDRVLIGEP